MVSPSISRPSTSQSSPGKTTVVLLSFAYLFALVSRLPEVIRKPQFWAEDGYIFYQQAHELGFLHSLIIPYAGYFHLFPRLIAGLSLPLGLSHAPLVFNAAALLIQCLPAIYLSTSRMQNIGPLKVRVLLAFLYLGVPYVADTYVNPTNSQWHLAVLNLLILLAAPSKKLLWMLFDAIALLIGALTGPFCIFLMPIALLVALARRSFWTTKQIGILGLGVAVQGTSLLLNGRPPVTTNLGASFSGFCQIVTFQIFLAPFPGATRAAQLAYDPTASLVVSYSVTGIGLALMMYLCLRGGLEIRCLILLAAIVLAACLASPIATAQGAQWEALQGNVVFRYWYIPRLAVAAATVWLATLPISKVVRYTAALALILLAVGDAVHWRLSSPTDMHFDEYAKTFNGLPIGSRMIIPINPPGWWFRITKTPHDPTSCDPGSSGNAGIPRSELKDELRAISPETIPYGQKSQTL